MHVIICYDYLMFIAQYFSMPRFNLFQPIKQLFTRKQTQKALFKNILFTYQNQIILGSFITIIFSSCNLLVPQLIKSFLHFIHQNHLNKKNQISAHDFIQYFLIVQFLRIIFGQHTKRLFNQLAIKIQSSLCKKLIIKSLNLSNQARSKISKNQIIQLQNVDLKLIFNMFKNFYLIIQAPFTIIVAIFLLFRENSVYGIIGIYWFIIIFIIQRQLDGRMKKCNQTKLQLIDQRSKINYQLFSNIQQAKLIHHEQILIEKNNDLFIEQNHDHHMYYFYSTIYDISLLILPIIVVGTISLFDSNNDQHITVSQVYVMLQLLGICYGPMKSFRNITINMHDGLHSLKRLQVFFAHQDQQHEQNIIINCKDLQKGQIIIAQDTIFTYNNSEKQDEFQLHINMHLQICSGKRLIIFGKKGQGKSSFLKCLLGRLKKQKGEIKLNGKIVCAMENQFIKKGTILENIVFHCEPQIMSDNQDLFQEYNQKVKLAQKLFKQFGLQNTFVLQKGIHTQIQKNMLTKSQIKMISILRAFISKADIYLFENVYQTFNRHKQSYKPIEKYLRQLQSQHNKTIIMAELTLQLAKPSDFILILENGKTQEFGNFDSLLQNQHSKISNFFKSKIDKENLNRRQPESGKKVLKRFQSRVSFAQSFDPRQYESFFSDQSYNNSPTLKITEIKLKSLPSLRSPLGLTFKSLNHINNQKIARNFTRKKTVDKSLQYKQFWNYFLYYMKSLSKKELIYILIIIAVAEFLHIFIHFYMGHLGQDLHDNPYIEFRNIFILEFILTLALALVIYFEGQVSSILCIIQGNNLYSQSLINVIKKPIQWYKNQFSLKLADKFNHVFQDYEQIFIAFHHLLNIYKNVIILVITIYVVSDNKIQLIITTLFVSFLYINIGKFLRKIKRKVIFHYYDYKYQFVRIFQQCFQGSPTIKIFQAQKDFIQKSQDFYKKLAAYKLSESYTAYGQEILCDIMSLLILTVAFQYGLQLKSNEKKYNTALVGTGIHLLLNVSEVLKNIIKLTINFQTFFNINILPFLETLKQTKCFQEGKFQSVSTEKSISDLKGLTLIKKDSKFSQQISYNIQALKFQNVLLGKEAEYIDPPKQDKLNFQINQGQTVFIYDACQKNRKLILQAITKNFYYSDSHEKINYKLKQNDQNLNNLNKKYGNIKLDGKNINQIQNQQLIQSIHCITSKNFLFNGTLKQNITWKYTHNLSFQEEQFIIRKARQLFLDLDLVDFQQKNLNLKIKPSNQQKILQFSKKIAMLRILIRKPKIVIIQSTSSFIDQLSICDIIRQNNPSTTIIKITNSLGQVQGCSRVIYMENLKIIEQGNPQKLKLDFDSKFRQKFQQFDLLNYKYQNQACSPMRMKKILKQESILSSNKSSNQTQLVSPSSYYKFGKFLK